MTFVQKSSYTYDEIISCGEGTMFGEGNAALPVKGIGAIPEQLEKKLKN